jgi:murein DD-endopeptidase MepM/ murein hydrolase activator NlpD
VALAAATGVLAVVLSTASAPPVDAVADGGARPRGGAAVAEPRSPGAAVSYAPPVSGPVVDPFRLPLGPYGPGNRGLEYTTVPGATARAIGAGSVTFAGQVAGRLVVTIEHPDGLRSSLVGLASVSVTRGQVVSARQPVGRAATRLHLGVRRGDVYLDPATLFAQRAPARLVPLRPR